MKKITVKMPPLKVAPIKVANPYGASPVAPSASKNAPMLHPSYFTTKNQTPAK